MLTLQPLVVSPAKRNSVIGVAPGLTNLLARLCVDGLPDAQGVDITVLIGLGERHGTAAVQWTVDGLTARQRRDGAGPGRARVSLPGFGTRGAYPFPFSDQHTLTETLGECTSHVSASFVATCR